MEQYSSHGDIIFGDVNLSKGSPRSPNAGSPGAGGWPTLRHYNAKTGIKGQQYLQKTSGQVCDEMKQENYMETYVMEAAVISRCSAADSAGCSDKEKEYIAKYRAAPAADMAAQAARLETMAETKGSKQSASGYKWLAARRAILKQLQGATQEL